jgi:hypothetical protein
MAKKDASMRSCCSAQLDWDTTLLTLLLLAKRLLPVTLF